MASKSALIIANTEYQDVSFAKLTAPAKDAEEFAYVLREPELAGFDDVQVLLNKSEGITRRTIARFFTDRKRDDLLLLYFSGHGIRNEQGQLFLAANDTDISILEATGVPADFITYAMNQSRSQRQVLILDCCNSGAFAYGSKSASAVGKSMGIAAAFEGSGFGRVVLTATDATQYAWEGDKVIGNTQTSVFTHFLIEGLKGEADLNGDGRINIDELYDYAYEQVVRRTPKQKPGKWSYKQQGDIVLRDNLKPRPVSSVQLPPELLGTSPIPLSPELLELLSDQSSAVRKAGIQELTDLINGKNLGLARSAYEKLQEIAENDDSLNLRRTAHDILVAPRIELEQFTEELSVAKPAPAVIRPAENKNERQTKKPFISPQEFFSPLRKKIRNFLQSRKLFERKLIIPKFDKLLFGRIFGLTIVIVLLGWTGKTIIDNLPTFNSLPPISTSALNSNATTTSHPSVTQISQPTETNRPSPTKTAVTPQPSQTSISLTPTLSPMISDKDGMTLLFVPAGEFTMGSSSIAGGSARTVYLDAFWIDRTEVTNKQYALCVAAGSCKPPFEIRSKTRPSYFGNSEFDNYPVIYLDWDQANAYCSWAGRRLPTEAEWEKAARGTDGRNYPWGEQEDCAYANFVGLPGERACIGDTTEVGNYASGRSPYGAYDMAGNVWEWVNDYYSIYEDLSSVNPQGPATGNLHVMRGGAWNTSGYPILAAYRDRFHSGYTDYNSIGFRCAMSATP